MSRSVGYAALAASLLAAPALKAATVTWDGANNNWTSTTLGGQPWANYDSAIFGIAGANTISVGSGVLVGKPTNSGAIAIDITTGNYTFNGSTLTFRNASGAGDGDMDLRIAGGATATFNVPLVSTNSGGNFRIQPQGDDTVVNLNAGYTLPHDSMIGWFNTGAVNFNVGGVSQATFTSNGTTSTGSTNIGNASLTTGYLTLWKNQFTVNNANAVVNVTNGWDDVIKAGQSNETESAVRVLNGTMNVTGGVAITNANRNSSDSGTVNGVGKLEVTGGAVTVSNDIALLRADKSNAIGNGQYVQSGGVVKTRGIVSGISSNNANVADGPGSVGSVALSGGSLYIGSTGIQKTIYGPTNVTVTLSGGTVGALADWSSSVDMTVSGGGVTLKAADDTNAAHNITLSGAISGNGDVTVSGAGTVLLQGNNTNTGDRIISSGSTLTLDNGSSLAFVIGNSGENNSISGMGTVNLNGAFSFNLTGASAFGSWTIVDNSTLTETFGSSFTVTGWTDAGSNKWTFGNYSFDESTGMLTSAIPEPTTFVMAAAGLGILTIARRRRARA